MRRLRRSQRTNRTALLTRMSDSFLWPSLTSNLPRTRAYSSSVTTPASSSLASRPSSAKRRSCLSPALSWPDRGRSTSSKFVAALPTIHSSTKTKESKKVQTNKLIGTTRSKGSWTARQAATMSSNSNSSDKNHLGRNLPSHPMKQGRSAEEQARIRN